jgi:dTDP-4-dehydrorhamnose reductase
MESVFITGIAGMLGSNIAYLLRDRFKVSGIDLNEVSIGGVANYTGSIFDTAALEKYLEENRTDVFIHCAALVNLDECEADPVYAEKLNFEVTRDLSELCRRKGIRFIFISTDALFDGEKQGLYTEEDTPRPKSVYGKTKLMAEESVLKAPDNLVIRTNIYGFNYREKYSFGEWIMASLLSGIELNMFYDILFSPILVNELAEIICQCIKQDVYGLYHISGTGAVSKYEIALVFREAFGREGSINGVSADSFDFKAPRAKNMGLDNKKIRERLNIEISTPKESVYKFKELYDMNYQFALKSGI